MYLCGKVKSDRIVTCGDKSRANSQTIAVGTIDLRPLYKVSKGRYTQG